MSETSETQEKKKTNKLLEIIFNNKIITTLFVIIFVLLAYIFIKTGSMQTSFEREIGLLRQSHITQIDSIKIVSSEQAVKVFSWAIRSEMNRGNLEEVNNLFLAFVQEDRIRMINLINPADSKIILSTDKKNEGLEVTNQNFLNVTEQMIVEDGEQTFVVSPIMGINRVTGILVVEILL